jgi:hypothetical protein
MHRFLSPAFALLLLCGSIQGQAPQLLPKANVLPLQLDDAVQFRKMTVFNNDPNTWKATQSEMLNFERQRANFGAVSGFDREQRYGTFYTFFWRTKRPADLKLRFEYRQEQLGNFVQAQELIYPGAKGNFTSKFSVTGDSYRHDGKVTAWRAILIEGNKIVALNQSYLWR